MSCMWGEALLLEKREWRLVAESVSCISCNMPSAEQLPNAEDTCSFLTPTPLSPTTLFASGEAHEGEGEAGTVPRSQRSRPSQDSSEMAQLCGAEKVSLNPLSGLSLLSLPTWKAKPNLQGRILQPVFLEGGGEFN